MRHANRKIAAASSAALVLLALAFAASAQAATKPVLTIEDASQITAFGAKLSGTVDPGGADSSCRFAFVTEARFQASGFENLSYGDYVNCDVNPVTGEGAQPVNAQLTLRPNTTYRFALEATNVEGTSFLEGAHTFTTPAIAPEVTTGPNTPFAGGKVHLLGYVDPEESPISSCKFVYGTEAGNYPQEAPCANHPGNEIQALGVGAIGGQFRLKFEGETTADLPYNATAAQVQSALEALPAIGAGGVSVKRVIEIPDYRRYWVSFEGPLADKNVEELGHENGAEPLKVNEPEQSTVYAVLVETLDEGGLGGRREVTADLSGLTPGATYHYRLIAANGTGPEESADAVFKVAEEESNNCTNAGALGASFLPECRAWEMVSPPNKNGGDVLTLSEAVRVATDGSAASFASPSPFADASGAGIDSEYESIRTAAGWKTHGILAQQPAGTFGDAVEALIPHYMGEFSSDMNKGIFFSIHTLDESDPNVEVAVNLYLRTDLRTPGAGTYRLLTGCPLCAEKSPPQPLNGMSGELAPWVVAASSDFKHVIFESKLNLVKGVNSTALKLYESEEGTVRLVGILQNSTAALESTAAGNHVPNQSPWNVAHTVSSDGSKVVWTDGTNVYLRLNHATTIQLNESELSPSEGNGIARFRDATPTDSKVFFFDGTRLSEDAPKGGGLYMYDTTKPASDPHNLSFVAPFSGSVTGISVTGETVYIGDSVWHNGQVRAIGTLKVVDQRNERVTPEGQLLFEDQVQPHPLQSQFSGYCPATASDPVCAAFYTYDPTTEALQCVSCLAPGEGVQGAASEIHHWGVGGGANFRRENNPISTDGRHVFFATNASLVPEDTNGVSDVYTFDTATSKVSLISKGIDPYPSYFMEATPDGSNAFFTTRQRLSGWDVDTNVDLYDARVNGGLPEPVQTAAICESEPSCHPAATQPPGQEPTTSESVTSPGNLKQTHCPRGTHPVQRGGQTRCVKPRHHKKKRRHAKRGGHK